MMQQPPGEIVDFMKSLQGGEHIALFQEDSQYARGIEFRFIHDGLKKGENCVYASIFDGPDEIEGKMEDFGIDVKDYKEKGLLHVQKLPVSPASNDAGGNKELEKFTTYATHASETIPFRVVGRLYSPTSMSKEELATNLKIERSSQESRKRKGITICSYSIKGMKPEFNADWFVKVMKSHDAAVFAPSPGIGTAFYFSRRY